MTVSYEKHVTRIDERLSFFVDCKLTWKTCQSTLPVESQRKVHVAVLRPKTVWRQNCFSGETSACICPESFNCLDKVQPRDEREPDLLELQPSTSVNLFGISLPFEEAKGHLLNSVRFLTGYSLLRRGIVTLPNCDCLGINIIKGNRSEFPKQARFKPERLENQSSGRTGLTHVMLLHWRRRLRITATQRSSWELNTYCDTVPTERLASDSTWLSTNSCTSSSGDPDSFCWPLWVSTHGVHKLI
eukprot:XP_008768456.1 PREDICTED: uncharacterized protein LOC103693161 isoform X1 [Rattus norvegicus]